MRKAFKILTNKFVITLIAFLAIMLFFDQNNLIVQWKRQRQLNTVKQNIQFLAKESGQMEQDLKSLNSNNDFVERYAREHYHEKRDNEDVFLIIPDSDSTPQK